MVARIIGAHLSLKRITLEYSRITQYSVFLLNPHILILEPRVVMGMGERVREQNFIKEESFSIPSRNCVSNAYQPLTIVLGLLNSQDIGVLICNPDAEFSISAPVQVLTPTLAGVYHSQLRNIKQQQDTIFQYHHARYISILLFWSKCSNFVIVKIVNIFCAIS